MNGHTLSATAWSLAAIAGFLAATASAALAVPTFSEPGYHLVYQLEIPNQGNYGSAAVPYAVDNAALIASRSFNRIGYMLDLQTAGGAMMYVSVSMGAFTNNAALIGVPTSGADVFNDTPVTGMNIESNVAGIATGTGLSGGFVQFWNNCYTSPSNSGTGYATGRDTQAVASPACYGSMQIGDGVGNTVLAYNHWSASGGNDDLGIGNAASGNSDWTFAGNAGNYTVKELSVYVENVPEPSSWALLGLGAICIAIARRRCV